MKSKILIRSKYLFVFCLFFPLFFSGGQEIEVRSFDPNEMFSYQNEPAFDYMKYTVQPPSIWDRLSWWLQSIVERIFLNPNTPWLTRILYYMLLILIVGAAIFYIVRLRYGGALATDYKSYQLNVGNVESTSSEDFNAMIKEALKHQNFKLAIRYLYLKTLITLSNKELVKLRDWKSPYDYERELKGELSTNYKQMARLFEYVWYGDHEAGEDQFEEGRKLFNEIDQKV